MVELLNHWVSRVGRVVQGAWGPILRQKKKKDKEKEKKGKEVEKGKGKMARKGNRKPFPQLSELSAGAIPDGQEQPCWLQEDPLQTNAQLNDSKHLV